MLWSNSVSTATNLVSILTVIKHVSHEQTPLLMALVQHRQLVHPLQGQQAQA